MDLSLMSPAELAAELGSRVRRERLRRNLSQQSLAERAGVSRLTVTRLEADGSATMASFLSVLVALGRAGDLAGVLAPPEPATIDEFLRGAEPARRRGRR